MQLVWDQINFSSIIAFAVQSVLLIVWLVRAYDTAAIAKKRADEAHEDFENYKRENESRHNVTMASIALIREQFVRKEDLQHLEAGIKDEFRELNKRLDNFFRDYAKRSSE